MKNKNIGIFRYIDYKDMEIGIREKRDWERKNIRNFDNEN